MAAGRRVMTRGHQDDRAFEMCYASASLYQVIFREKYISAATTRNRPMLPVRRAKCCRIMMTKMKAENSVSIRLKKIVFDESGRNVRAYHATSNTVAIVAIQ